MVPLNYNFTFTCLDTHGVTSKVGADHVSPKCEIYMTRVFHACYTRGYSTHNLHEWIFHAMYTCGHACVFMALLFYVCITSSNNSLNILNFMKCQHKYHTFTIPTIM